MILKAFQILISRKILLFINIISFIFKYYFFGSHSAIISLSRYSKYSLIVILKFFGAKIGNKCDIESGITFHNCINFKNLVVGNNCHIGKDCFFDLRDKIEIEDNVVISMRNTFLTHIDMSKSELTKKYPPLAKEIKIKKNSYLGASCNILMGVSIGEFSFIAASSLINKDVPPYTMVGGVPAKFIKKIEIKDE